MTAREIREAAAGDAAAQRTLLRRHGALVWSLARRLDPEPEDAYQEIWEKVVRGLPGFDPAGPAKLSTWIATVAHRHLVDRHRARGAREPRGLAEPPAPGPSMEATLERSRQLVALDRAVAALPTELRRLVLMHHVEGMTTRAIAEGEGLAEGTVKSRLNRARAHLTEAIGGAR